MASSELGNIILSSVRSLPGEFKDNSAFVATCSKIKIILKRGFIVMLEVLRVGADHGRVDEPG